MSSRVSWYGGVCKLSSKKWTTCNTWRDKNNNAPLFLPCSFWTLTPRCGRERFGKTWFTKERKAEHGTQNWWQIATYANIKVRNTCNLKSQTKGWAQTSAYTINSFFSCSFSQPLPLVHWSRYHLPSGKITDMTSAA